MGLLDHRRTWHIRTQAKPGECVAAFSGVFAGGTGAPLLMRAHWKVNSTATGVIAVYEGRGGVGKVGSVLFGRAAEEEASAVGSTISFEAEALASGETACRMWLSSRSTNWGFTSDGRFFRPYMRAVARRITTFDPNAVIELN